jgi:hypothetical protein
MWLGPDMWDLGSATHRPGCPSDPPETEATGTYHEHQL